MLRKACFLFFVALWLTPLSLVYAQQKTRFMQHLWEVDPPFGNIWTTEVRNRTIQFDVEKLNSPHAQDRVEVAQYICMEHDNPKFTQRDRAISLIIDKLKAGEEDLQIKRALIAAALSIDAEKHAEFLWSIAKSDPTITAMVESKLVQWKSTAALLEWRQRLGAPKAKPTDLATAIEGIGQIGTAEDRAGLQWLLLANETSSANKVLAASSLGNLLDDGLNDLAQQILGSDLPQRHLMAAHLLKRHTEGNTEAQLRTILAEGNDSAKTVVYRAISESMPRVALELAKPMSAASDATLRTLALNVLQRSGDEEHLRIQGGLLNDPNDGVRELATRNLIDKGQNGHRATVDEIVLANMKAGSVPGMVKAIDIVVAFQDRRYCKGFVRLLEHERYEVSLHAAWALMELAVDPSILASMLTHAEKVTAELQAPDYKTTDKTVTDQIRLSYLHEAFGKNRYMEANAMLLKFVPKVGHKFGIVSRSSAIWALGRLNKHQDNPELRASLYERMRDFEPRNPESFLVRFACNLALGDMAHPESIDVIEQYNEDLPSPLGYAANWALAEIEKASKVKEQK